MRPFRLSKTCQNPFQPQYSDLILIFSFSSNCKQMGISASVSQEARTSDDSLGHKMSRWKSCREIARRCWKDGMDIHPQRAENDSLRGGGGKKGIWWECFGSGSIGENIATGVHAGLHHSWSPLLCFYVCLIYYPNIQFRFRVRQKKKREKKRKDRRTVHGMPNKSAAAVITSVASASVNY